MKAALSVVLLFSILSASTLACPNLEGSFRCLVYYSDGEVGTTMMSINQSENIYSFIEDGRSYSINPDGKYRYVDGLDTKSNCVDSNKMISILGQENRMQLNTETILTDAKKTLKISLFADSRDINNPKGLFYKMFCDEY